ncbi:hypothetical protein HanIR_Chr12g0600721 [Helianthus annuus]|nr:hypothetical protein HanIR_Chr12g0600721 [Helianthus annuus]KAJ0506417.1 hypothetical protein HanHA89_Chr12g0481731 [Helianthus annuus]KAJ0676093.1 hypothetical protein HanLR1_Chr12g0458711 [Helianthus annuus]
MAEPSNPLSTAAENPEPSSRTTEEVAKVNAPGKSLPELRWTESAFETLMTGIQILEAYGARYPQEGYTAGDAPAGFVSMFADWFGDCNLQLPFTVFVVEILEYYKLHISHLSIEPSVGDFRRFYQLTVQLGFFSFRQWEGAHKLMSPPKGMTKWKTKFFYVKAAAVTAKLQFRKVTRTIVIENISTPKAEMVDWFPRLPIIGSKKLDNRQLLVLRMMIDRLDRRARPVLREKNDGKCLCICVFICLLVCVNNLRRWVGSGNSFMEDVLP